jgi:hypothetical protein
VGGAGGRVHPVGNAATEFTNTIKELILIGTSQKLDRHTDTHTSGKAEEAGKILNCVNRKCFELQSSVPKDKQIVIYVGRELLHHDGDGKRTNQIRMTNSDAK